MDHDVDRYLLENELSSFKKKKIKISEYPSDRNIFSHLHSPSLTAKTRAQNSIAHLLDAPSTSLMSLSSH